MAAVIIRKKDLKLLGKKLLKEIFEFLHDEYILTEFKDMKKIQKEFLENLEKNNIKVGSNDIEGIYLTLDDLKLDMEIDEDLYYKTKAFLDIFRVFESEYTYLED